MKAIFMVVFLLASPGAWAHGEDKPGPNGGQIRMPGNFHVEAVVGAEGVEIFLLDINFKNPVVEASEVKVKHSLSKATTNLNCERKQKSFFCKFPKKEMAGRGQLIVEAKRAGQAGSMAATYDLGSKTEHSGHH